MVKIKLWDYELLSKLYWILKVGLPLSSDRAWLINTEEAVRLD